MPAGHILKAHCNDCGRSINQTVMASFDPPPWVSEDAPTFWEHYQVIRCNGCDTISYRTVKANDQNTDRDDNPIEDVEQFPPASYRPVPDWMYEFDATSDIKRLLEEVYVALQNNTLALATMGVRSIIEHIAIDQVTDHGTFGQNLKELKKAGKISADQETVLEAALEVGHAAIHRSHAPTAEQLKLALDVTEHLIVGLYFLPEQAKKVRLGIPPRPARPPK